MYDWLVWFMVFDATFNTILAILWQSVFMIGILYLFIDHDIYSGGHRGRDRMVV
jgi:hypothetical protein